MKEKMRYPIHASKRIVVFVSAAVAVVIAAGLIESQRSHGQSAEANVPRASSANSAQTGVELSPSQLNAVKIEPVGTYMFPVDKEAVGDIDFDGDLSVQVFPPYQGTVINTLVQLGAEVRKGQPLYTIRSPEHRVSSCGG